MMDSGVAVWRIGIYRSAGLSHTRFEKSRTSQGRWS